MASSSLLPARSTSLPTRSHPIHEIIDEQLREMRDWLSIPHPAAAEMSVGINRLVNLFDSMEEVLSLPLARQAIARLRTKKCVEELLDGYVKLLDVCNASRDAIVFIKEHVQDLRSTIRRRGANTSTARDVEAYLRSRKNLKNEVHSCQKALKAMEDRDSCFLNITEKDVDEWLVMKVLKDVRGISISVFRSLLSFTSTHKSAANRPRWLSVTRAFITKRNAVVSDEAGGQMTVLESLDASILSLHRCVSNKGINDGMVQHAQKRLGCLESCMVGLEAGVECIFKRLIQNRVSLLNILSL